MQFRVPQNISIEDRIVGPLTAIQFAITVLGGGVSFVILSSSLTPPLNQIAAGSMALFTAILVLGKFNDQPLYRFFRFIVAFLFSPKTRIWHKGGGEVQLVKAKAKVNKGQGKRLIKKVSAQDIAGLALVMDSRGSSGINPRIHPAPAENAAQKS